jgi:hypothetical protein
MGGIRADEASRRDSRKLRMTLRLQKETTMTLAWIAQRLHMGTKTHLSHVLYWQPTSRWSHRDRRPGGDAAVGILRGRVVGCQRHRQGYV